MFYNTRTSRKYEQAAFRRVANWDTHIHKSTIENGTLAQVKWDGHTLGNTQNGTCIHTDKHTF